MSRRFILNNNLPSLFVHQTHGINSNTFSRTSGQFQTRISKHLTSVCYCFSSCTLTLKMFHFAFWKRFSLYLDIIANKGNLDFRDVNKGMDE